VFHSRRHLNSMHMVAQGLAGGGGRGQDTGSKAVAGRKGFTGTAQSSVRALPLTDIQTELTRPMAKSEWWAGGSAQRYLVQWPHMVAPGATTSTPQAPQRPHLGMAGPPGLTDCTYVTATGADEAAEVEAAGVPEEEEAAEAGGTTVDGAGADGADGAGAGGGGGAGAGALGRSHVVCPSVCQ
jgi:hypothetical protein